MMAGVAIDGKAILGMLADTIEDAEADAPDLPLLRDRLRRIEAYLGARLAEDAATIADLEGRIGRAAAALAGGSEGE